MKFISRFFWRWYRSDSLGLTMAWPLYGLPFLRSVIASTMPWHCLPRWEVITDGLSRERWQHRPQQVDADLEIAGRCWWKCTSPLLCLTGRGSVKNTTPSAPVANMDWKWHNNTQQYWILTLPVPTPAWWCWLLRLWTSGRLFAWCRGADCQRFPC